MFIQQHFNTITPHLSLLYSAQSYGLFLPGASEVIQCLLEVSVGPAGYYYFQDMNSLRHFLNQQNFWAQFGGNAPNIVEMYGQLLN